MRAQRAALAAASVVALLVPVALAAPLLTAIEGQSPHHTAPTSCGTNWGSRWCASPTV
ncbi:hypothetical protein [Streptomyces ambofaciens]|uniref:hypothetical protein n=1 Tax=Streptomyces ambofaciens TaxID=1889 RepID=UPI003CC7F5CA